MSKIIVSYLWIFIAVAFAIVGAVTGDDVCRVLSALYILASIIERK